MEHTAGYAVVPHWVVRDTDITAHALLVFLVLSSRANRNGECWPAVPLIAKEARVSVSTARRALRELEAAGLVTTTARAYSDGSQGASLYRIQLFEDRTTDLIIDDSDEDFPEEGRVTVTPPPGQRDPNPRSDVPPPPVRLTDEVTTLEVTTSKYLNTPSSATMERVFDEAYSHWPKKVERKAALAKFILASKRRGLAQLTADVIRFGDAYAASTQRQFVPALGVWLNGERWTDDLPSKPSEPRYGQRVVETPEEATARILALASVDLAALSAGD